MATINTATAPAQLPAAEYAFVLFPEAWPELTVAINLAAARLRTQGRPVAAVIVEQAWTDARQAQAAMAREMAVVATKELKESEKRTRVRPDTDGDGGPRLGDYLQADVMPHQDILPGSVGVANYDLLDQEVPWWVTNEVGSDARVGDKLFGLFYGGGGDEEPPNPDSGADRVHPLFTPAPASAGGGQGFIENPIPARRFVEKALPAIERQWHARFDAIHTGLLAELARANATFR